MGDLKLYPIHFNASAAFWNKAVTNNGLPGVIQKTVNVSVAAFLCLGELCINTVYVPVNMMLVILNNIAPSEPTPPRNLQNLPGNRGHQPAAPERQEPVFRAPVHPMPPEPAPPQHQPRNQPAPPEPRVPMFGGPIQNIPRAQAPIEPPRNEPSTFDKVKSVATGVVKDTARYGWSLTVALGKRMWDAIPVIPELEDLM